MPTDVLRQPALAAERVPGDVRPGSARTQRGGGGSSPGDTWTQLPEDSRPKLLVMGESLGSFGGEGPPNANRIWSDITSHRDDGSPEWLPVYEKGELVRFGAIAPQDLPRPGPEWGEPRMITCSTRRTRSPGGHRSSCCTSRTGSTNSVAKTSSTAPVGSRS